jgi:hypothetical protein
MEIILNTGLDSLEFGDGTEKAIAIFGQPDNTEIIDEAEIDWTLIHNYPETGLAIMFDGREKPAFFSCDCTSEDLVLAGKKIIGLHQQDIIALMHELGYDNPETEDENWGEKRVSFELAGIDFYFEEDELVAVSWGKEFE